VIGIGIDAVEIERFRRALARTVTLADRLFTAAERAEAAGQRDPVPRLASRFAAQGAVMKALGVGLGAFAFGEAEGTRSVTGRPELRLSGGALALASRRGVVGWHVSITHTATLAQAVVVAL